MCVISLKTITFCHMLILKAGLLQGAHILYMFFLPTVLAWMQAVNTNATVKVESVFQHSEVIIWHEIQCRTRGSKLGRVGGICCTAWKSFYGEAPLQYNLSVITSTLYIVPEPYVRQQQVLQGQEHLEAN